jgi:hypothetical protein
MASGGPKYVVARLMANLDLVVAMQLRRYFETLAETPFLNWS